jgi:predicted ATPase
MLRRVVVDNFRCLVNFEFRPARVNLLLGRNGSGKSTLFDALRSVSRLLHGDAVAAVLPPDSLPWWDLRRAQTFELELEPPQGGAPFVYRVVIRHQARQPPRIAEERLTQGDEVLLELATGQLRLPGLDRPLPFDGAHSAFALGLGLSEAASAFRRQATRTLVFKLNPWAFEPEARREDPVLHVDGSNLVAFLRHWSQEAPEAFLSWKRTARELMPHLDDLQLRELAPGSRMLVGAKLVDGRELLLGLESFSEGERALLVLHAIAALGSPDRLIALDEPDNFLSASEVQPVLRAFTLDAPEGAGPQLFVASHHPESIDYLASYPTWLFERSDQGVSRVRLLEFDRDRGVRPTDSVMAELAG